MKSIVLAIALVFSQAVFGQDYYDPYPQGNYSGYEYYDNSYNYPDDYYYNYPTDYYPEQYYQANYNDYRKAVFSVNWNNFFVQYNLSPWQRNQIVILNNRFASYDAWNSYYRWNPDRWYYDRFFALQNILGPQVFVVYQNVYFNGNHPINYYCNHRINYYSNRYPVRPVYRNVNINIYKVNRHDFKDGFRTPPRNAGMINPNRNDGFRNQPRSGSDGGLGNNNSRYENQASNNKNDGFRTRPEMRSNNSGREQRVQENNGFRNNNRINESNQRRIESSPRNETRNSGFRIASK